MAQITATLNRDLVFPSQGIRLFRFNIPSVPASSISDEIIFDFVDANHAQILNLRISCESINYDFSLRLEPGVTPPTVEEIYDVINVNDTFLDNVVYTYWAKPTGVDEHKLFGILKNNDANPTGQVDFEFVLVCY